MCLSKSRSLMSALILLSGLTLSQHSAAQLQTETPIISPAQDLDSNLVLFAFSWPADRTNLTADTFDPANAPDSPIMLTHFTPAGTDLAPAHPLRGELRLDAVDFEIQRYGKAVEQQISIPAIVLPVITNGDRILPVPDPESVVIDRRRRYTLLFGVGRVWQEAGDNGRSRALMPVSLIDSHANTVRNGLASFLYSEEQVVSGVYLQFSQETALYRQADLWAVAAAQFKARSVPAAEKRIKAFEHRQATAPLYRDWAALERKIPAETLQGFDGAVGRRGDVAVSGLIDGDVTYLNTCTTRHGPYPFCRQMRHAVQTASASLFGFIAVAHLVHQFGTELLDMTIPQLVPELQVHPQWRRVRVRDLLNMASGLGETAPVRVPGYVQADNDAMATALKQAGTAAEKLAIAARFPAYPWAPGKVFRFRTADSFVLAVALDRFVKNKLGPRSSIRWMLQNRLLNDLGIPRMQMAMTVGNNPADRVPDIGSGLFPSTGEIVRLSLVLRQAQGSLRRTGLSTALTREALSPELPVGLTTGLSFPSGQGRYLFTFWRTPWTVKANCQLHIPSAHGYGGTVISFMPNGITGFRIADGDPADPTTRDSSDLRRVGQALRRFCIQ